MRIKFSKLCLLTGIGMMCFSTQSFASNCSLAPDCASLGYTKSSSDCNGLDTIKCPFNTSKVFCVEAADKEVQTETLIVYGDGTVSNKILTDKTPMGIVFDESKRLAVALTFVDKNGKPDSDGNMPWSSSYCDIPNLVNCPIDPNEVLLCGTDGRANTNAILANSCNGTTYAADAVNAYAPSGCVANFCQQGKWFLPSYKELDDMANMRPKINNTLKLLRSKWTTYDVHDNWYWTSTERASSDVWAYNVTYTGWNAAYGKTHDWNSVRPFVKY